MFKEVKESPCARHEGTRWRREVSFTTGPLYLCTYRTELIWALWRREKSVHRQFTTKMLSAKYVDQ